MRRDCEFYVLLIALPSSLGTNKCDILAVLKEKKKSKKNDQESSEISMLRRCCVDIADIVNLVDINAIPTDDQR